MSMFGPLTLNGREWAPSSLIDVTVLDRIHIISFVNNTSKSRSSSASKFGPVQDANQAFLQKQLPLLQAVLVLVTGHRALVPPPIMVIL